MSSGGGPLTPAAVGLAIKSPPAVLKFAAPSPLGSRCPTTQRAPRSLPRCRRPAIMVARVRNEPRTGAAPVGGRMLPKGRGRGGSERLLADTVAHLDPARYRVEVAYLLPWKDALADEVAASGAGV